MVDIMVCEDKRGVIEDKLPFFPLFIIWDWNLVWKLRYCLKIRVIYGARKIISRFYTSYILINSFYVFKLF